jgi:hypothetical protein
MECAFNPLYLNSRITSDKIYYVNYASRLFLIPQLSVLLGHPFLFIGKLKYFKSLDPLVKSTEGGRFIKSQRDFIF